MPAELMDGRVQSAKLLEATREDAAAFASETGRPAKLAVLLVGDDNASQVYVRRIVRGFQGAGLEAQSIVLPGSATDADLHAQIDALNADSSVDGILLQLPLPAGFSANAAVARIDPDKDVDGITPAQAGRLLLGQPSLVPNTPAGGLALLDAYGVPIQGAEAVIIGRSAIVGKPLALLLLARHATVTICHTRTRDLGEVSRRADILCVAAGRAGLVNGGMIKPGAVVLDFGVNSGENGLVGDVDFESASAVAGLITPVPGGTGPMTNVMLMQNTLTAARMRLNPAR